MDAKTQHRTRPNATQGLLTEDELENRAVARDGLLRRFLFIADAERSRALNVSIMVFLIIFVYSALKCMKNAIVASQIDPSAISYIKICVLLVNIVMIAFTQKMVSIRNVSRTFTLMMSGFAVFFCLYGALCFYLFRFTSPKPSGDMFCDGKMAFRGFGIVFYVLFRTFTSARVVLYYLSSELYGSIITSYLFWAFTNEFLTRRQSLRFTPFMLMSGNVGLLLSGLFLGWLNEILKNSSYEANQYFAVAFLPFCGILCMVVCFQKSYFERNILTSEILQVREDTRKTPSAPRRKVSFIDAFKITFASRLVLGISICVFAYNFALNIIEGFCIRTYKVRAENSRQGIKQEHHLKALESSGQVIVAVIVILLSFLPSGQFIQRGYFSYYALFPCIVSVLGTLFVISIGNFNVSAIKKNNHTGGIFGSWEARLFWEEKIAFAFMIMFRIIKYAAFDLTKEALSMRINPTYRAVFKGVYDGHFGKLSKACGAMYSIAANSYYDDWDIRMSSVPSFILLMSLNAMWISMVLYLSRKFDTATSQNKDIELDWVQGKPMF